MTNIFRGNLVVKTTIVFLLVSTVATALLVPHLVNGHILNLSVPGTQSLIIGVDLLIAGILIFVLNREIMRERHVRRDLTLRLTDSYRYIGRANITLGMIRDHSAAVAQARSRKELHDALHRLHGAISGSVSGAVSARTRIIAVADQRTITEFTWATDPAVPVPPISNGRIFDTELANNVTSGKIEIKSGSTQDEVVCVFVAHTEHPDECNMELLRMLVNHIHLLYVLSGARDGGKIRA